jgi:hypothetical protein
LNYKAAKVDDITSALAIDLKKVFQFIGGVMDFEEDD